MDSPTRFIVDTHCLWWYLRSPERLTPAVSAVFRLAETGNAKLVVPAITVAEFYFLSNKLGHPISPAALLTTLSSVSGVQLSNLGRVQLERLDQFPEVPEMHDRLIAAESVVHDAPILTRDSTLAASPQVDTIW